MVAGPGLVGDARAAPAASAAPASPAAPAPALAPATPGMPALRRKGTTVELVVDGKPFLILGGELANSSASSSKYLDAIWPKLAALHLNTVLVPVYWELIEPAEGKFDFSALGHAIDRARQQRLHVVLLWFGSWKNGMSSYAPAWVKRDARRFPRAEVAGGRAIEELSAFGGQTRDVDARAFAALMKWLRQIDGTRHTVLMVQVENEVAMIDDAADRSAAAQTAFAAPVPKDLIAALVAHRAKRQADLEAGLPADLPGELAQAWNGRGARESGTWAEVFGPGIATDEIFMAWHLARYVDAVTRAGKAEYPLPMFVNAALNRPGARPGQYPSGGPLPHLFDVWRAGAPNVDFLAPDIYFSTFAEWTAKYARADNPLFVPEAKNDEACGVHALYAIGEHQALGFSPFAVDSIEDPARARLAASYQILTQIAPLVLAARGPGGPGGQRTMAAVLLDKDSPEREVTLGGYRIRFRHDYSWEWSGPGRLAPIWPRAGAVIINTGPREYMMAGNGVIATFAPDAPTSGPSGIERIEEGTFENGKWIAGRRLNGDENHQGRHLRLPAGAFGIQRIWLYQAQ